jgi:Concanavalin A-like lectin/glucanases superfamily
LIFTQVAETNMNLKRYCIFAILVLAGLSCGQSSGDTVAEYLFNGNANDTALLNGAQDGTVVGASSFGTGLYKLSGQALVQNATAQSITLPAGDYIRNVPGATLAAWIRPDLVDTGAHSIMVFNNSDATVGGGLGASRANIQINGTSFRAIGRPGDAAAGGSTTITGGTAVQGLSYFVAGVFQYATGSMQLYVNGQQVAQTSAIAGWTANVPDTPSLAARIGANFDGSAEYFVGAIDGARVFNTAMDATQILNLYNLEAFPPGDTDGNGVVELADLDPIKANWRMTGKTKAQGNLSGDAGGLVDFSDFRIWKTGFIGAGGGSLDGIDLSFASVPEPAAIGLALIGLLMPLGWRRRGQ